MAKMRVHELAKELGKESKEILSLLKEKGIEVKTASSNIEDEAINLVKRAFLKEAKPEAKNEPAKEPAKEPSVKQVKEEPKKALEMTEAPKGAAKEAANSKAQKPEAPVKKKKNITAVFNSQYSSRGGNDKRRQRPNDKTPDRRGPIKPTVERRTGPIRPRPDGERPIRPRVTPTVMPVEDTIKPQPKVPEKTVEKPAEKIVEKPVEKPVEKAVEAPVTETTPVVFEPKKEKVFVKFPEEKPVPKKEKVFVKPDNRNQRPGRNDNRDQRDNRDNRDNKPGASQDKKDAGTGGKGGRDKKGGKRIEHDKSGGKHEERTINLEKAKLKKHVKQGEMKTVVRSEDDILTLVLPERLTIKTLCEKMQVAPSEVIKKLFMKGMMVTVNQDITYDQAEEIAMEFNCICEPEEKVDVIAELLKEDDDNPDNMVKRPPVVCVMGHVDHGKTSLLDAIRSTNVTDKEAGGITQKIGAYMVNVGGEKITFLDTPGHEAFTAMRMRGASSTDIAILVVAADDGVMPQTVEAIDHARVAGVEIIVAINKIDKPGANLDRVKKELAEHELVSEEWGGSTVFCEVSAKTGQGIDNLLDMVLLTAEVLELKADPKRNARGLVIEAELDKGRGVVATVLVQKGTLHVGDPVAAGKSFGKVRAMVDEHGKRIKKAGPSVPVEILGLSEVPNAGEIFMQMDSEKEARNFAGTFVSVGKDKLVEDSRQKVSLDALFSQIQAGNLKELNLIIKADVQGSVEAVRTSLEKLSNDEVVVKIIHAGVGAINESDVTLASASNAIIIGFNVRHDNIAKQRADEEGIDIRLYNVIYNIIEDVDSAMKGMLEPEYEEKVIGHAVVRQIFKASEIGNIAGSYVTDGELIRDCKVRIYRRDDLIFEGELSSLRRFKDNVKEVKAGFECGLVFNDFQEFEVDDTIEGYKMVEVKRG